MRPRQTTRAFKHNQIRNRLAELQNRFRLQDEARQIIHNEIKSASLYWFIQAAGLKLILKKCLTRNDSTRSRTNTSPLERLKIAL